MIQRLFLSLGVVLALCSFCGPVSAQQVGVVLLHGTGGGPDSPGGMIAFSEQIEKAGFLVERPEMCWSAPRIFDRTLLDCMTDVDVAIRRLQNRGATSIVVAGFSRGGFGAILYGSLHPEVKGVIALSPGPDPSQAEVRDVIASMATARDLIAAGKGEEKHFFTMTSLGLGMPVMCSPKIFVSQWDMSGPANMVTDATKLKMPIFWVSGTMDRFQLPRESGFDRVPANTKNRYLLVTGSHEDPLYQAADAAVAWLKELARLP